MGWRDIEHVVVLMQENNSFDRILGWMTPGDHDVDGVPVGSGNPARKPLFADGEVVPVEPGARLVAPGAPHQFYDMVRQLHPHDGAPNSGFADVAAQFAEHRLKLHGPQERADLVREVLRYHRRDDLPVTRDLALSYAVADRWFSPIASSTWPNRYFAHFGRSPSGGLPLPQLQTDLPSIYSRLTDAGLDWRIYVDGLACVSACEGVVHEAKRVVRSGKPNPIRPFSQFLCDVSTSAPPSADPAVLQHFEGAGVDLATSPLPAYTFIEPRHVDAHGIPANNDHHGTHKHRGQRLIGTIYNALRSDEERWKKTLFIVIYDENGGYFDHVPPPAAPHPDTGVLGKKPDAAAVDWYGARVPAMLISPWIARGGYHHVCDHTSVLAFLERRFGLPPLTARDAAADDLTAAFGDVCDLGPERVELPPEPSADGEAVDAPGLEHAMVKDLARRFGKDGEVELATLERRELVELSELRQQALLESIG